MAEYIERQAARPDAFCEGVSCLECPFLKDPINGTCRVDDFITALPAADVWPVVRGRWKKNDNGTYSCERCHSWIPEEQWHYANWCLYCGADMRGGDAE